MTEEVLFPPPDVFKDLYEIKIRPHQLQCCTPKEFKLYAEGKRVSARIFCEEALPEFCAEQAKLGKCIRLKLYIPVRV